MNVPADLNVDSYTVLIETPAGCISLAESNEIVVHPNDNQAPTTTGVNGTNEYIVYIPAEATECFDLFTFDNPDEPVRFSQTPVLSNSNFITDGEFQQSGTFCWTPSFDDIGFHELVFTIEDDNVCYSEQTTFTIEVKVSCPYCPNEIFYENRQPVPDGIPLPSETEASYRIVAGEDVDDSQTNGLVIVGDADVTFRATEVITIEPGFQGGPGFSAIIDPNSCVYECEECCENWDGFSISLPNFFTPNGSPGVNDFLDFFDFEHPFCAYNAQNFELKVFNRWGTQVHQLNGVSGECCPFESRSSENQILHSSIFWDGRDENGNMHSDGEYFYIVTLKGCGNQESFSGSATLIGGSEISTSSNDMLIQESFSLTKDNNGDVSEEDKILLAEEFNNFNKPKVYPNPTSDQLFVSLVSKDSYIEVYSLDGRLVLSYDCDGYTSSLDVSNLQSGSYVIQVSWQDQVHTETIVKQ